MSKSKERSSSEYFKSIIRKLKSENKQLKKRLKQLERNKHLFEENELEDPEETIFDDKPKLIFCKECTKGHIEELAIAGRVFHICNLCKHRTKVL